MELNISESTLERLRCSVCKGYLSCSPIRIIPDGSSLCGRCSPQDKDEPTYLQLNLEAIMHEATFPCKFSENGCKKRLKFGETNITEHEVECDYRNGPRPESPQAGCSREATQEIVKSTIVLHDAELTLKVDRDEEKIPVVMNNSTVINPFHVRRTSNASIVSVRHWNGNFANSPPRSPAGDRRWNENNYSFRSNDNNANRDWNNSFSRNDDYFHRERGYSSGRNDNDYFHRDWNNMPPHQRWQPYNNDSGYRRRPYHNRRKNNLVIIKGHTIYVTL